MTRGFVSGVGASSAIGACVFRLVIFFVMARFLTRPRLYATGGRWLRLLLRISAYPFGEVLSHSMRMGAWEKQGDMQAHRVDRQLYPLGLWW
jgi:hypothetical protein